MANFGNVGPMSFLNDDDDGDPELDDCWYYAGVQLNLAMPGTDYIP